MASLPWSLPGRPTGQVFGIYPQVLSPSGPQFPQPPNVMGWGFWLSKAVVKVLGFTLRPGKTSPLAESLSSPVAAFVN